MLVISNNCRRFIELPGEAVVRLNLAWYSTLEILKAQIEDCMAQGFTSIMLDFPVGRSKPPKTDYVFAEVMAEVAQYPQVEYVAVSNIGHAADVKFYQRHTECQVVPKIETVGGLDRIEQILGTLSCYASPVIMLDHDDLFRDLVATGHDPDDLYRVHVKQLAARCRDAGVGILTTAGVVFTDQQKPPLS